MGVIRWANEMVKGLWTVLIGMRITWRYFLTPPVTMHYPDEKWQMPERFRGMIKCDIDICIVCDLCVKACPVDCITIHWERQEGKSGKVATGFIVDYQKCIVCGLCTEPCPTLAIFHSHDYEIASFDRLPALVDWAKAENKIKNPKGKPMKKAKPKPKPVAAGTATGVADAPAPGTETDVPALENKPEFKDKAIHVWIDPGCIVCDLCQDTCPDVFNVTAETCLIIPESRTEWPGLTEGIVQAAEECPVNVIKYTIGG